MSIQLGWNHFLLNLILTWNNIIYSPVLVLKWNLNESDLLEILQKHSKEKRFIIN